MTKKKTAAAVKKYVALTRIHYKSGLPDSRYIDPTDPPEKGERFDLEHLTNVDRIILVKRGIVKEVN